jgi:hypothetical protein
MSFMEPNMQLNAKQLLREDDSLLRQVRGSGGGGRRGKGEAC